MADLVQRLRRKIISPFSLDDVADHIELLEAQNKALREALEWLESRAMKHWIGNPMHVEASICLPRIRTALADKGEG